MQKAYYGHCFTVFFSFQNINKANGTPCENTFHIYYIHGTLADCDRVTMNSS